MLTACGFQEFFRQFFCWPFSLAQVCVKWSSQNVAKMHFKKRAWIVLDLQMNDTQQRALMCYILFLNV